MSDKKETATGGDKADETKKDPSKQTGGDKTPETMIPKIRLDEVIQQKKELQQTLETVAADLLEDIPENFRDLVPNLPAAEKIKWLREAIKKGLFSVRQVEDGPDSKRPRRADVPKNFDGMNPQQIMAMGYKK